MTSEIDNLLDNDLYSCPFIHLCILPKNEHCHISRYKVCTEYTQKCKRLKPNHLY